MHIKEWLPCLHKNEDSMRDLFASYSALGLHMTIPKKLCPCRVPGMYAWPALV